MRPADVADGHPPDAADGRADCEPSFQLYLDTVRGDLHALGVPGIFTAPGSVEHLERLFDADAPLDVVRRGVDRAVRQRLAKGKDVRRLAELLPTIRAELRSAGWVR